jgi:hypothetical protein
MENANTKSFIFLSQGTMEPQYGRWIIMVDTDTATHHTNQACTLIRETAKLIRVYFGQILGIIGEHFENHYVQVLSS